MAFFSFNERANDTEYFRCYSGSIQEFSNQMVLLLDEIKSADISSETDKGRIKEQMESARLKLKAIDFWLRYLEPIVYRKINAPLPVEWETEAYEKWKKPYKREGAGLTLAETYLDEENIERDSLGKLISLAIDALPAYMADSITLHLAAYHHFFLANRMFLMNLAAIYTTGFECPNTGNVIPELREMLKEVRGIYWCFNRSFPETPLTGSYLELYDSAVDFTDQQQSDFTQFDHFTFIKDYVNPLFGMNQRMINSYKAVSRNLNDYSLGDTAYSIFDKSLYQMQYTKGVFSLVEDKTALNELDRLGKLLFFDPILSGNNQRSCASCHDPGQYFTDTTVKTALHFDREQRIRRNSPSLVDVIYNHLIMLDGKHISLQAQVPAVINNPSEMGGNETEAVEKVMGCSEYKSSFKKLLKLAPGEKEVNIRHIAAAIAFYYSKFSSYYAPFDKAMNYDMPLDEKGKKGFNLFMSKAQCATCHFVPFFNGIKPPYVGSEFEVIGAPADTGFAMLSEDLGRYEVHPVPEMRNAFRTPTVRNIQFTKPYMHNGVFNTLEQVIDFYDGGGGQGRGLDVPNQTLSADSLKLSAEEKEALISFMMSLNEEVVFDDPPSGLPASGDKSLNSRKVGGEF